MLLAAPRRHLAFRPLSQLLGSSPLEPYRSAAHTSIGLACYSLLMHVPESSGD